MYKPDNTSLDLLVLSTDWSNFYNWSFITFELHTETHIVSEQSISFWHGDFPLAVCIPRGIFSVCVTS